jgi:hypothetical protein
MGNDIEERKDNRTRRRLELIATFAQRAVSMHLYYTSILGWMSVANSLPVSPRTRGDKQLLPRVRGGLGRSLDSHALGQKEAI